jgi:hypothetical protein
MHLGRTASTESAVMSAASIVSEEPIASLLYLVTVLQFGILPDMLAVVLVEPFYASVALWMPDGAEDKLCSHVESKAKDLAQDSGVGETTAETSFVVRLGVLGDSHLLPDVNQKGLSVHRPSTLVGLACWIARNNIDGVEASHRVTASQVARHDVDLE